VNLERLRRAHSVLRIVVVCLVGLVCAVGGLARADDAPPSPPPVAPPAPVAPPETTAPLDVEQLLAWTKRKPVPAPAWRDAAIVQARFAEAVAAVEQECGVRFETPPTLRISTSAEVRKIVRAELAELPTSLGLGDLSPFVIDAHVAALLAKYELATHVVHVVPETVETISGLLGVELGSEAVLRVVLAHECTHALDFRRFPWRELRTKVSGESELAAFDAIVEGHAQFVAKRVAATWRLSGAFDTFTKAIGAVPDDLPEAFRSLFRAMASEATFGYWKGAAFLEAVAAEVGGEGVLRALTTPPKTTREIEHPEEWLHPELATSGLDPTPALTALQALVPSPPWIVQQMSLLEDTVRSQLADAPADEVAKALGGFREAKGLVAKGIEMEMLVVLCMRCSTQAQAQALVAVDRRASEAKDAKLKTGLVRVTSAEYVEGAGSDGRWGGFTVAKRVTAGPTTLPVTTAVFAAGDFAFEVAVSGREVERAWMDRVVDALGAYVTEKDHPLPRFPPDAVLKFPIGPGGFDLNGARLVRMTVLDAEGKAVHRCSLEVMHEEESRSNRTSLSFQDGRVMIPRPDETADLLFHSATDEGGKPLDLGPLLVPGIDLRAADLKFVLPAGRAVEGRVVDDTGKGVSGAQVRGRLVRVSPGRPGSASRVEIASAVTDAEGRYRLRGLGESTRVDVEPPSPLVAPNPILVQGTGPAADVVVAEGGSAVVTVTDPDGKPVAGAEVRWGRVFHSGPGSKETEWESSDARTDSAGRVELSGMPAAGPIGLSVAPRMGSDLGRFNDWGWDGRELQVALKRVQRIQGHVFDTEGKPARRGTVHLKVGQTRHTTSLRPGGTFFFDDVEPGLASVGVTAGEYPADREPKVWVPVVPGKPVELVLGGAALPVTIRGLEAGRFVFTRSAGADGPVRTRTSSAGGVVSLPGEVLGSRIDVFVEPTADDPRGLVALGIELTAKGIALELVPCASTRGTVRAVTGWKHLEVHVLAPWRLIPLEVGADGTFEVPPLPPGSYSLRAKARGAESWIYARAEFEPGATLELELRPK